MAEPEPEPNPEGEPEGGSRSGQRGYQWLDGAPVAEGERILDEFDTGILTQVIMPTVALFVFLISGLMIHSMLNQKRWWRNFMGKIKCTVFRSKLGRRDTFVIQGNEQLLTAADCNVVEAYNKFPNRPPDLMKLLFPALISLTGSPTLLVLKNFINKGFFPRSILQPNMNDSLQCFLIPAGMLYATVFGFSLEICVWRFHGLGDLVSNHYKALRNAMATIVHDRKMSPERKVKLMRKLKDEIITLMEVFMKTWHFQTRGIQESCPIDLTQGVYSFMLEVGDYNIKESEVYDVLERRDETGKHSGRVADREPHVSSEEKMVYCDYMSTVIDSRWKIVVQSEMTSMNTMQSCSWSFLADALLGPYLGLLITGTMTVLWGLRTLIGWIFLEFLAYTSYFGILMLVASSALLELVMCTVTVTSISMFSYILSDISSPLHGFFRISYAAHMDLLRRMQLMAISDTSTWGDLMDPTTFQWRKHKAMTDDSVRNSKQGLINKKEHKLTKAHTN